MGVLQRFMRAMSGRLYSGPGRTIAHCLIESPRCSLPSTGMISGSSLRTQAKGMSMPSNDLSLSQWDSPYANRTAAPLTSNLRLQKSSTGTGEASVRNDNVGTRMGVGGGGEVEIVEEN